MYRVKYLKKTHNHEKGAVVELDDLSTQWAQDRKEIKVLRYLGGLHNSPYYAKKKIPKIKVEIEKLQSKLKYYERLAEMEDDSE